ncbi:MAG: hypothetical protein ACKVS5_02765 [Parvularculaceae bacterium]
MTASLVLELIGSLAGVAILVGVSYWLGAWRNASVTLENASDRLAFDEPDFKAGAWLIGRDGRSAAAVSADRAEIALIFALGDGLATRRFNRKTARLSVEGAGLVVHLGEPSRRAVRLAGASAQDAEQWLLRLTHDDL